MLSETREGSGATEFHATHRRSSPRTSSSRPSMSSRWRAGRRAGCCPPAASEARRRRSGPSGAPAWARLTRRARCRLSSSSVFALAGSRRAAGGPLALSLDPGDGPIAPSAIPTSACPPARLAFGARPSAGLGFGLRRLAATRRQRPPSLRLPRGTPQRDGRGDHASSTAVPTIPARVTVASTPRCRRPAARPTPSRGASAAGDPPSAARGRYPVNRPTDTTGNGAEQARQALCAVIDGQGAGTPILHQQEGDG
jgi:hypothetical protein